MIDPQKLASPQSKVDLSVSFTEYVKRAIKRNDQEEIRNLLEVFGAERLERVLRQEGITS